MTLHPLHSKKLRHLNESCRRNRDYKGKSFCLYTCLDIQQSEKKSIQKLTGASWGLRKHFLMCQSTMPAQSTRILPQFILTSPFCCSQQLSAALQGSARIKSKDLEGSIFTWMQKGLEPNSSTARTPHQHCWAYLPRRGTDLGQTTAMFRLAPSHTQRKPGSAGKLLCDQKKKKRVLFMKLI